MKVNIRKYYLLITAFAVCMGLIFGSCELPDTSTPGQEIENEGEGEQEGEGEGLGEQEGEEETGEEETEEDIVDNGGETGTGSLSGNLTIATDSYDLGDRDVWLASGISEVTVKLSKNGKIVRKTTSGADYAFTEIPAGTYQLEAEKGPYDYIETITVGAEPLIKNIKLAVFPGLKLTVKVDKTSPSSSMFILPIIYKTSGNPDINLNIDWGDGTPVIENLTDHPVSKEDPNYIHDYNGSIESVAREFTIRITGKAIYSSDYSKLAFNFGLGTWGSPVDRASADATGYLSGANRDKIIKAAGNVTELYKSGTNNSYGFLFYDCRELSDISGMVFTDDEYGNQGASFLEYAFVNTKISTVPGSLLPGFSAAPSGLLSHAFENCKNLTTVEEGFLKGLTGTKNLLMQYAFNGCTKLAYIDLFAKEVESPTTNNTTGAFTGVGSEVAGGVTLRIHSSTEFAPSTVAGGLVDANVKEILVPSGLVETYKTHEKWGGGGITAAKFKALPLSG
jgi:hypothetical protein